jgi:hypothetical protein
MIYHVKQDGADFYLHNGPNLVAVITYPPGCSFDLKEAERARTWFRDLMKQWKVQAEF